MNCADWLWAAGWLAAIIAAGVVGLTTKNSYVWLATLCLGFWILGWLGMPSYPGRIRRRR